MKKGFAYLAVLFLLAAALSAAGFFTYTALHWRRIIKMDLDILQAGQMAQNAAVYLDAARSGLNIAAHDLRTVTRADLLRLAGLDFTAGTQGFRIVQNREDFYFIGYAGELPEPAAVYILYLKQRGTLEPWRE